MSFPSLIRILILSCFALVASHTTDAVVSPDDHGSRLVSNWQAKDNGFFPPARVQVVSTFQPAVKPDLGSGRNASATFADGCTHEVAFACAPAEIGSPLCSPNESHLDTSSNGPRAPPQA